MALVLRHFVAQHPHAARMRKLVARRADPVRPSVPNRVWYAGTLMHHLVRPLRAAGAAALEALRPHWPQPARVGDAKRPPAPPAVKHEIARARGKVAGVGRFAVHVSTQFARKNLQAVDERLAASVKRSVGVDIRGGLMEHGPILDEMRRAQRENAELIESIPEMYLEDVEGILAEGWERGASWESMVSEVAEAGGVAERRAAFIARDQTNKANAAFNRARQTSLGIERAVWATAGDDDVRETHAEMEGKEFEWDDPPLVGDDYLLPGEDYNCRCVGEPVIDLADRDEPDLAEVDEDDEDFDDELLN